MLEGDEWVWTVEIYQILHLPVCSVLVIFPCTGIFFCTRYGNSRRLRLVLSHP